MGFTSSLTASNTTKHWGNCGFQRSTKQKPMTTEFVGCFMVIILPHIWYPDIFMCSWFLNWCLNVTFSWHVEILASSVPFVSFNSKHTSWYMYLAEFESGSAILNLTILLKQRTFQWLPELWVQMRGLSGHTTTWLSCRPWQIIPNDSSIILFFYSQNFRLYIILSKQPIILNYSQCITSYIQLWPKTVHE